MLRFLSFSVQVLISPSNLNKDLAGSSTVVVSFFPFITLNISCHSLLACGVSAKNSAGNLIGMPLYVVYCFSLIFNFCEFDYVSSHVPPWVNPVWNSLQFLFLAVFSYYLFR